MLYNRYSNPMELVYRYIKQGRFSKFVYDFMDAEVKRRKETAEKDQELMLWIAYVHSAMFSSENESYSDWKKKVLKPVNTNGRGTDTNMSVDDAKAIVEELFGKE